MTKMQLAGKKAWVTRLANEESEKWRKAGLKAWATRRKNRLSVIASKAWVTRRKNGN